MEMFNPNNRISLNDMVEGIANGNAYRVVSYSLGDRYTDEINSFRSLSKFILEIDYNQLTNITIDEL